jgi:hypothetical protein
MGAENHAAVAPLWGANAALSSAARVFLYPGFASAAGHLGAGLGVVGALPLIKLIDYYGLVNQRMVHRRGEDGLVHFNVAYRLALLIYDRKFHILILKKP